jgi:diguanylate cyclase (GGDEF)-like protein
MPSILLAGLPNELAAWLPQRLPGLTVRTAATGAATLDALAQGDCALLVIDHRLADPTAPEILRRAHDDLGRADLPVVYCLPPGLGGGLVGHLVGQLHVGRMLFQPLDREELARTVAGSLGLPLATPPARGDPPRAQQTLAAVAAMWERFRERIFARVAVVEQATMALLQGTLDDALRDQARHEAHRLAGSVGTFGFPEASRLAREIEQVFAAAEPPGEAQARQLSEWVGALRRDLERGPADQQPTAPTGEDAVVLIVDDDALLAARIVAEAAGRGLRAIAAPDLAAARTAITRERPDVVLLDLGFPGTDEDGLTLLAELAARTPPLPVVVYTAREGFADRVEVARLGGRAFLQKPVPPAQVLETITQVLQQARAHDATVMVVDDDPAVLELLHALLAPRRIEVHPLDDPLRFWDALEQATPDLLVLDVDMPHLNGIELCRVVRNDPRWRELPVLFLTGHTDADTVRRVFAAGADDYVSKPIVGPELIARITNRLERTLLHRSMAEIDALTGVANRRKSDQVLSQYLRVAERQGQPLSLAVLDLDHFKLVNDRYGHAAGDAVLRRFGRLLLRSFRGEDVVARWGGEEFVVGMYGMTRDRAVPRLAAVLAALRQEEFTTAAGDQWRVSFSAGVAEYPTDGTDVQTLYRAADQALYQAKEAGRDRVLPTGA